MTIPDSARPLMASKPLAHATTLNARIYMGPDVQLPPLALRDRRGFVARLTSRRFAGVGPWASRA